MISSSPALPCLALSQLSSVNGVCTPSHLPHEIESYLRTQIFITELTLGAWIHTEENQRQTLQRHDIAMAITKCDEFDFLTDVPRDEWKPTKHQEKQRWYVTLAEPVQDCFRLAQQPLGPSQ